MSNNYDQAGSTMLDIRQEWSYIDLNMHKDAAYFPSDSIKTLDSLVAQLFVRQRDAALMRLVLKEIKRVNEKLDQVNE
ncbi:hypothetical protein [Dyadobacter sandarakinus]|uniref:Uncharacterized protein n=1 Tax=Dyadobacter sandarakinus TaxID=2747268 RepID=A0ABX7IBD4_9BACT|nr:hypothetical protein [Dyadobacter sandarakinus]QRR03431.1 hypothetical protein HWI92_22210 [Dyadobacter sandarakinus]